MTSYIFITKQLHQLTCFLRKNPKDRERKWKRVSYKEYILLHRRYSLWLLWKLLPNWQILDFFSNHSYFWDENFDSLSCISITALSDAYEGRWTQYRHNWQDQFMIYSYEKNEHFLTIYNLFLSKFCNNKVIFISLSCSEAQNVFIYTCVYI